MKLFVVYSQFIDSPSRVKGIFSTLEQAEAVKKVWEKSPSNTDPTFIERFDLDEVIDDPVVLS